MHTRHGTSDGTTEDVNNGSVREFLVSTLKGQLIQGQGVVKAVVDTSSKKNTARKR